MGAGFPFGRFFSRSTPDQPEPKHPGSDQPQSDTFVPGDQAECIVDGPWFNLFGTVSSGPAKGEVRIVKQVCSGGCHLEFARWPARFYVAGAFRKVIPRADALERAEPAFLELVRKPQSETV
jgi:hypothetical protein